MTPSVTDTARAFQVLRGFSRPRKREESCDLCGLPVGTAHAHLLQVADSQILCACNACAILFSHRADDPGRKLLRITDEVRRLDAFQIDDAQWDALRLPIDLAFFLQSSKAGHVLAYYPSPAGNTESLLSLDAWDELARQNPVVRRLRPDVEALLVDRTRGNRRYFLAPIDQCYKLTGLIRRHWRGFSGGSAVWTEVDAFFDHLAEHAHG